MASFTPNYGANIAAPQFNDLATPTGTTPLTSGTGYLGGLEEYASPVGNREQLLDVIFQQLLGYGQAGTAGIGNIAGLLSGTPTLSDEALRADKKWAKRSFEHDQAAQRESFGRMGARFGTDLATAQSRSAEDFRLGLNKNVLSTRMQLAENAKARSLQALNAILGLGQFGTGLEFTRGESAASRRMEELIQELKNAGMLDVTALQGEIDIDKIIAGLGGAGLE